MLGARSLAAIIALPWLMRPAAAGEIADKIKLSGIIQSVRFHGDFRGRQEHFERKDPGSNDRNRMRYRLRIGTDIQLPEEVLFGFRLGAGSGEQISNNQTFDNLSSQKAIFVDMAYLRWTPKPREALATHASGGKMPNSLWRIYSSDLVWDDDLNPEGFQENVEWKTPWGFSLFGNFLQMVADEDLETPRNQWVFSEQVGFETKLPWDIRLRSAAAYHKWSDENRSTFSQVGINLGNRRAGASPGVLVNRFGVGEVTTEFAGQLGRVPLSLQTTLARNLRARTDLDGPRARDGYQYGLIAGRAKEAGSWEVGLFKKYAQSDATVADVSDSDFGDGGTNRWGGIFWLAHCPWEWLQLRAKYFSTRTIDLQLPPGGSSVNRLMLDAQVRF